MNNTDKIGNVADKQSHSVGGSAGARAELASRGEGPSARPWGSHPSKTLRESPVNVATLNRDPQS